MHRLNPMLDSRYTAFHDLPQVRELIRRRNTCPEDEIEAIDEALINVITPCVSPPPRRLSMRPIDPGFHTRAHDMKVAIPSDIEIVDYDDSDGEAHVVAGDWEHIAYVLAAMGYSVTVTETPESGPDPEPNP